MRHGNDELAVLLRKLFEELPLQKFNVDNGERAPVALRGKDVAVPDGNRDLYRFHLRLAEQRVPSIRFVEGGAQHGVCILCDVAGRESELGEDWRVEDRRNVRRRIHHEGFASHLFRIEGKRDGNEHGWDGGGSSLDWVAACESVGALACGVNEGWHGALCMCRL